MNRRLAKEGKTSNFQVGSLPWGSRIPDSPLIVHDKGDGNVKHYLQLCIDERGKPTATYFLDGKEIAKSAVSGLPGSRPATNQKLEDDVKVRTFAAASIVRIRAWGEEFEA